MLVFAIFLLHSVAFWERSLQQDNCIGYNPTTKNCYECMYTHYHSLNMTYDKLIYPSNCSARKNESIILRYFISVKKCTNSTFCNGTEQYPFDEINRAFWMAHTQANERIFSQVEFYLLGGPHYILRKNLPQVNFGNFRRANMTVSLMPCYCTFKNLSGCYGPDESTLIYVKTDSFNIYISNKLIVKNIIFNGTDMHLLLLAKDNDLTNCYNKEQICCNYTSRNTIFQTTSKTPCALKTRSLTATPPETWNNRTGFFNIEPILDDPNRLIPELTLENILFCDMYTAKSVNGWLSLILLGSNTLGKCTFRNVTILDIRLIKGIILANQLETTIPLASDFKNIWSLRLGEAPPDIEINMSYFISYNKFNVIMNNVFKRTELGVISLFDFTGILSINNSVLDSFIFSNFEISLLHFENSYLVKFNNVTIQNFVFVMLMNLINSTMIMETIAFLNVSTMEGLFLESNSLLAINNMFVSNFTGIYKSSALFFQSQKYSSVALSNVAFIDSTYLSFDFKFSIFRMFNISFGNIFLAISFLQLANTDFQASLLNFTNIIVPANDFFVYRTTIPYPCVLSNVTLNNITVSNNPIVSFFRWANGVSGSQFFWTDTKIINSNIPLLLLAEKIDQLYFLNFEAVNLSFVGLTILDVSSIWKVSIQNISLTNIFSDAFLIKVGMCYNVDACVTFFNNVTVKNASKQKSDWIVFSVTSLEIRNIIIENISNVDGIFTPRRIFFFDQIQTLNAENISLAVFLHSFRCFFETNNNQNVFIKGLTIINYWTDSSNPNFFGSAISASQGKTFDIENITLKGLAGIPDESSIAYKNGFMNFFGSESDMIKRENNIKISMKNVEIIDCGGWPYGVVGFSNIDTIVLENINMQNTSAALKGGALIITLATYADIKNIHLNDVRSLQGGSLYFKSIVSITIANIEVNGSSADDGGVFHLTLIKDAIIKSAIAFGTNAIGKGGLFYIDKVNIHLTDIFSHNSYSGSEGGVIFNSYGNLKIENGNFHSSSSRKAGFAAILHTESLSLSNSVIQGSSGTDRAVSLLFLEVGEILITNLVITDGIGPSCLGNVYIESQGESKYMLYNISCKNNDILLGNCIYFLAENDMEVRNISVTGSGGSAFYYLSRRGSSLSILDCILEQNLFGNLSLVKDFLGYFQNMDIKVFGKQIMVNRNSALKALLQFENCNITLENFVFQDNRGLNINQPYADILSYGGNLHLTNITRSTGKIEASASLCFLYSKYGNVSLSLSAISNCTGSGDRACINLESVTFATFQTVKFFSNKGPRIGALYSRFSNLNIANCFFSENTHANIFSIENIDFILSSIELKASDILFESASTKSNMSLEIRNCTFDINLNSISISIYKSNNFTIDNSSFKSNKGKCSAAFLFSSSGLIKASNFSNLTDPEGGAAVKGLNFDTTVASQIIISFSQFFQNRGGLGGAIIFQGFLRITIGDSNFIQNKANVSPGIGGAVYFTCLVCQNCSLDLTNNDFFDNSAIYLAPTVFSQVEINKEKVRSNTFRNNSDQMGYTNNISCFPIAASISPVRDAQTGKVIAWNEFSDLDIIISGREFDFNLSLTDSFGQPLIFENTSDSTLQKSIQSNAQVFGGFGQSYMGVHSFHKTHVSYKPSSFLALELIVNFDERLTLPRALEKNPQNNLLIEWNLFVRPCLVGEIMVLGDSSCYYCKAGEYSLVDPMKVNESASILMCKPCPVGAQCPGGAELIPEYGFWRANEFSSKMVECVSRSFCLGGLVESATASEKTHGRCLNHHEGTMCYKCESGYARSGTKGICESCRSNTLLQFKMIIAILLVYCYIVFQIKLTFSGESKSSVGILMKQLLSHAQLIQMISVLDLGWTPDILDYFHYQEYFSFLSEEMVSLDCIFEGIGEDNLILRIITANLIPFIMAVTVVINLSVYVFFTRIFRKKKINSKQVYLYIKVSIVIIVYVFFPEILRKSFSLMNCVVIDDVNNTEVVTLSPENQCWDEKHYQRVYKISFPGIFFWGVFTPFFALCLLIKHRKNVRLVIRARRDINNRTPIKTHPQLGIIEAGGGSCVFSENATPLFKSDKNLDGKSNMLGSPIINLNFNMKTNIRDSLKNEPDTPLTPVKTIVLEDKTIKKPNDIAIIFKFLYRGYKEKYFFWEIVIYLKKFVLTVISSFTGLFPSNTKATILLVIISFFLLLQARYRPFEVLHLNNVEFYSLLVTFLTANVGIMLYSEDLKPFSTVFLTFLILFNFLFLAYWLFVVVKEFFKGIKIKSN